MNSLLKIAAFSIWLSVGIYSKGIGQNETLRFERIGFEQGLNDNTITAILQDRKGYIWIGTNDGLNKYDGYSFTQYKFDPLDSNSLSQNLIYTIWEDKDEFIWVSTFEGLCKFDRRTEKFSRYKPDAKSKFPDPNILVISEDNSGVMWLGGASGGLCRFDKSTCKFYDENFGPQIRKGSDTAMLHNGILCIYNDRAGVLWVGNHSGLHKLMIDSTKDGQPIIKNYFFNRWNSKELRGNLVGNIFEDRTGILWLSTANGLYSFDKKAEVFKPYRNDRKQMHSISTNELVGWGIRSGIVEDLEANLWITTYKNGLNKLNSDRTAFTSYTHHPTDINTLSSDKISHVLLDRSGILWVGTADSYLNKVNLKQKPFTLKQNDPDNNRSLSNSNVTAITEDKTGIVWIGTDGGGLNRWDKKTNEFTHYRYNVNNPRSLRSDVVNAIHEDREGNLWVCNGDVLSLLNKQTGEFTHYNSNAKNFRDADQFLILAITEDTDGLLWLGTGNGVKSFNKKTGKFTHLYHNPADSTGISDYTAKAIFADSKNNIWVGFGSIATDKLEKATDRITHYKHNAADSESISSNIVNSFYEDSKGNLWLATAAGGLCRFDYKTDKFSTLTTQHGLSDNSVFSILEDDQNNLWLSTRNGISRFEPEKKVFTNYGYKDGLQSNYFAAGHRDRPARCKGHDGILYFGGNNGFNFFDPSKIEPSKLVAPVVITQFKLFDSLVKGANEKKEIVLNYDENYFSFEFASLSFHNADKNQYAYQLEGVDKTWVQSGTRRYAGYTNIGPGKHIFRVKATNSEGVWNEEAASIIVIIKPPWWRTWWAYFIYGALLMLAIFLIHKYQKQRLVRAEREKAQKKELAQAKEIEKAYHELRSTQAQLIQSEKMASLGELTAGIAHEIQNPLNFVNNFSEVNAELIDELEREAGKGNLSEVKSIAASLKDNEQKINHHGKRADAIVKGMLQHSRVSSGKKEPTDINALANEYLNLSYHAMRAKDKSFNATLQTDFDKSLEKIPLIPQDMGRVLLNLYNNAFHSMMVKMKANQTTYKPTISVATKQEDQKVIITVKDNGMGIPEKIKDKIFQPFFTTKPAGQGTGLGLSLTYDIVTKEHGGEITVNSIEGIDAEFIVSLPV